jgi:hypothetical protein
MSVGACPCGSGIPAKRCCWRSFNRWRKASVGRFDIQNSNSAHPKCYLSPMGGCSDKITKEHFISRNILEKLDPKTVRIQNAGHMFGGKDDITIGHDSFSAKVLCDYHNSLLSPLDDVAGKMFLDAESIVELFVKNMNINRLYIASGTDLERWMVKVYCGLVAAHAIRGADGKYVDVSEITPLLPSLIGESCLNPPFGLYFFHYQGQNLTAKQGQISTIQISDGSGDVGGIILALSVLNVVLVTSNKFGHVFTNENWHRHLNVPWNINMPFRRCAYVFTFESP